jgi:AraC family transcriptional regulator of adaptative response/methylated-DNA-[protein]-cysteine methyltransferase
MTKSELTTNETERLQWRAVQRRDSRFDGRFVFAVRSTGIFCRPTCPARRPRREQVVFFGNSSAAVASGFRPCRRCQPHRAQVPPSQLELVRRICCVIEADSTERRSLKSLGLEFGLSPHHLQRIFKRRMGISPHQYAAACRLKNLKSHLKKGMGVTHALYEAGYGSSSRLYEQSNAQLGMTPLTYLRGGRGMKIHFTTFQSPLGRILLAATERGICFLCLGTVDRPLETALREEYPAAEIHRDGIYLGRWVKAILQYVQGNRIPTSLPLDVQATAFQWRIWKELQKIPYGSTRSYSAIARAVGRPKAARAVARACATNRVSLVIPCHRVVREDGALGGYRWGLDRKQALLAMEKSNKPRVSKNG